VYLGSPTGLASSPAWTADGDPESSFGACVTGAGDVNGDTYDDVAVAAYLTDGGENHEGRVYVYLGSASGLSTSPAWTAESDQEGAFFGRSVASAGDVNGDTFDDLIVGAFGFDNGQTNEGRAFLYLGSAAGLSPTPAWTAESDQPHAKFGWSVSGAGDVDGDTYDDLIIGAVSYINAHQVEGRAYVYLGSATGPALSPVWTDGENIRPSSAMPCLAPAT
jgi:hypothetical protein